AGRTARAGADDAFGCTRARPSAARDARGADGGVHVGRAAVRSARPTWLCTGAPGGEIARDWRPVARRDAGASLPRSDAGGVARWGGGEGAARGFRGAARR